MVERQTTCFYFTQLDIKDKNIYQDHGILYSPEPTISGKSTESRRTWPPEHPPNRVWWGYLFFVLYYGVLVPFAVFQMTELVDFVLPKHSWNCKFWAVLMACFWAEDFTMLQFKNTNSISY